MTHFLRIDTSPRKTDSISRTLADSYFSALKNATVVTRDVSGGFPFVNEQWIGANFTPKDARTEAQKQTLALSDSLVDELKQAETIVITVPVYNFGIPAALKSWIDMVCRVGETFKYSETGPEGLLTGKKAVLLLASGGTQVDSEIDFATPYMRQALRFIGINDITAIAADGLGRDAARRESAIIDAQALGKAAA